MDVEILTFGGGDGGRFDRGNMSGRVLGKTRLIAGVGDAVCLRALIGERDALRRRTDVIVCPVAT